MARILLCIAVWSLSLTPGSCLLCSDGLDGKCEMCTGPCNYDDDCKPGLRCFRRDWTSHPRCGTVGRAPCNPTTTISGDACCGQPQITLACPEGTRIVAGAIMGTCNSQACVAGETMCSTESCDTGGDESWFGEIQCSNSTSDVDGTPSAVSYTDSEGEPLFGVSPEGRSAVPYCEAYSAVFENNLCYYDENFCDNRRDSTKCGHCKGTCTDDDQCKGSLTCMRASEALTFGCSQRSEGTNTQVNTGTGICFDLHLVKKFRKAVARSVKRDGANVYDFVCSGQGQLAHVPYQANGYDYGYGYRCECFDSSIGTGPTCSEYSDSTTCNGAGTAISDGSCTCWGDANSNLGRGPTCSEFFSNTACNSKGTVDDYGVCTCFDSAVGTGPTCTEYSDRETCNGNGKAQSDGSCICYDSSIGVGPTCSEFKDGTTCNGNGEVFYPLHVAPRNPTNNSRTSTWLQLQAPMGDRDLHGATMGDRDLHGATFCNTDVDDSTCCELAPGRYGNADSSDCGSHMNSMLTSSPCPGNDQISYIKIPGSCSVKLFKHSGHPRERPADGQEVWVLNGPGEFQASEGHFGDNTVSDATIDCSYAPFTSDACVCSNGASTACGMGLPRPICMYVQGDGTGGSETSLGHAENGDECALLVQTTAPSANGATYSNNGGTSCYAEFGMTGVSSASTAWKTCLFERNLGPLPPPPPPPPRRPNDCRYVKQSNEGATTFEASRQACRSSFPSERADLAVIRSQAENDEAVSVCKFGDDTNCYIGLEHVHGEWRWVDGTSLGHDGRSNGHYHDGWLSAEPGCKEADCSGREDVVSIYSDNKWHDTGSKNSMSGQNRLCEVCSGPALHPHGIPTSYDNYDMLLNANMEDPNSCPEQQSSDADDGWARVFAIYDDRSNDDLPNTAAEIGAGFTRPNAFFVGNDVLNMLDIVEVEACAGACGSTMACRSIDPSLIHQTVRDTAPATLTTDLKKMIGCFTGQCETDAGGCNLMAQGGYTECTLFIDQGWSDNHACGCVSLYSDTDWHVDGSGLSMKRASTGAEFGRWSDYQGEVNAFVIRLKARYQAEVLSVRSSGECRCWDSAKGNGPSCTEYSNSLTCSGNGKVSFIGTCECYDSTLGEGPNCTTYTDEKTCSRVGTVDRNGNCTCWDSSTGLGPSCSEFTDATTCNSNGTVHDDGSCSCWSSAVGTGPTCSEFTDSTTCNGNGKAQPDGSCVCLDSVSGLGPTCSEFTDSTTCNGNGKAQPDGSCVCLDSVSGLGPTCSEFTDATTCNSNGTVHDDGSCSCWSSAVGTGPTCSEFTDSTTCNGNGKAQPDGSCVCWSSKRGRGPTCSELTSSTTCNGKGTVQDNGSCVCYDPAVGTGLTCTEYTNDATCSGQGIAQSDGSCICHNHARGLGYANCSAALSNKVSCSDAGMVNLVPVPTTSTTTTTTTTLAPVLICGTRDNPEACTDVRARTLSHDDTTGDDATLLLTFEVCAPCTNRNVSFQYRLDGENSSSDGSNYTDFETPATCTDNKWTSGAREWSNGGLGFSQRVTVTSLTTNTTEIPTTTSTSPKLPFADDFVPKCSQWYEPSKYYYPYYYQDDSSQDDFPTGDYPYSAGFRSNLGSSYFVGLQELAKMPTLEGQRVEICAIISDSCSVNCINAQRLEPQVSCGEFDSLALTTTQRAVAIMAGACNGQFGDSIAFFQPNQFNKDTFYHDPEQLEVCGSGESGKESWHWTCDGNADGPKRYGSANVPNFHVWGSGIDFRPEHTGVEIGYHNGGTDSVPRTDGCYGIPIGNVDGFFARIQHGKVSHNCTSANRSNKEDLSSCPEQQSSDADDGWARVFAIYDDRSNDDLPNTAAEIGAGFTRPNAFFVGNDVLNMLDIVEVEACAGACGSTMACRSIDPSLIHQTVRDTAPATLTTDLKKMIGCFTGQCETDAGSCNLMAQGGYTECTLFTEQGWSDSHACGCVSLYSDTDWHVDGSGLSMTRASTGAEFGRWSDYQGEVNAFVIRLKARNQAGVFSTPEPVPVGPPTAVVVTTAEEGMARAANDGALDCSGLDLLESGSGDNAIDVQMDDDESYTTESSNSVSEDHQRFVGLWDEEKYSLSCDCWDPSHVAGPSCSEYLATDKCSGNGLLDSAENCICFDPNVGGTSCNISLTTDVCSGKGAYNPHDGSCLCFSSTLGEGPTCSEYTDSTTCNGNGVAQKDGSCMCFDSIRGVGPTCSEFSNAMTCGDKGIATEDGGCFWFCDTVRATDGDDGCSEMKKCGKCEGDCDDDNDCLEGLVCLDRDYDDDDPQLVPGCVGRYDPRGAGRGVDYCYDPADEVVHDHGEPREVHCGRGRGRRYAGRKVWGTFGFLAAFGLFCVLVVKFKEYYAAREILKQFASQNPIVAKTIGGDQLIIRDWALVGDLRKELVKQNPSVGKFDAVVLAHPTEGNLDPTATQNADEECWQEPYLLPTL